MIGASCRYVSPFLTGQCSYVALVARLERWARRRETRLRDLHTHDLERRVQGVLSPLRVIRQAIGEQQRKEALQQRYTFLSVEASVDPVAKRALPPKGGFVVFNEPIPVNLFPSYVAAMLKYKKHEWVFAGLESDSGVGTAWVNKGTDAHSAAFTVSLHTLLEKAVGRGCGALLFLHNHPNPDPARVTTLIASELDMGFARDLARMAEAEGMAFFAFVCERGRFLEYFRNVPGDLLPLSEFLPPEPDLLDRELVQSRDAPSRGQ